MAKKDDAIEAEIVHSPEQLRELTTMNRISDGDLRKISEQEDAFGAALAYAAEVYGTVDDVAQELGNGFALVEKDSLVAEPMLLLQWVVNDGEHGDFVSIAAVTQSQRKVIFNDGSSGVRDQLIEYTQRTKRTGALLASQGLNESTYPTCFECEKAFPKNRVACPHCGYEGDKRKTGKTFYINLSA